MDEPSDVPRRVYFISYTRQEPADLDLARTISRELRSAGDEVFLDEEIEPGRFWSAAIEEAAARCTHFVVLLSRTAANRDMVVEEVRRVANRRPSPTIVSVRIPLVFELPYEIGAYLNRRQAIVWGSPADTPRVIEAIRSATTAAPPPPLVDVGEWPPSEPVKVLRLVGLEASPPCVVPVRLIKGVARLCSEMAPALLMLAEVDEWLDEAGPVLGVEPRLDSDMLPDFNQDRLVFWMAAFNRAPTRGARVLVALLAALPTPVVETYRNEIMTTLKRVSPAVFGPTT